MKLLSPQEVAEYTGLPYAKALLLIKSMPYLRIGKCYYVSEKALGAYLNQNKAVEIMDTAG